MSSSKEAKQLRRKLKKAYGKQLSIVATSGGHYAVIRKSDGRQICCIPKSPSDHRSLLNNKSELRKAGFDLRDK